MPLSSSCTILIKNKRMPGHRNNTDDRAFFLAQERLYNKI